jgi:hypothetical protein
MSSKLLFNVLGKRRNLVHTGDFKFEGRFQRLFGNLSIADKDLRSGLLTVENRLRRKSDQEWLSQEYPLQITVHDEDT